ncbi:hypothetical protein GCM10023213_19700 [Prosthecobacter algae]|uniref:4Fe-4S ferredoxin-type domain-containing protein n=1 Tax=Prosthecobacter algae TaxID=1144682 RepID=A0ABP9P3V3_9BACT
MSVGLRRGTLYPGVITIEEARLCGSCEIVVKEATCPLCDEATVEHPEIKAVDQRYCLDCAAEKPDDQLRVKPWTHDPYTQAEGMLITCCLKCLKEEEG